MSKFILNGKNYSGSTNYASAITYTKEDGTKSTVQDELDVVNDSLNELNTNLSEQNKNIGIKYDSETDQILIRNSSGEWVVWKDGISRKWLFDKGLTFDETTGGWSPVSTGAGEANVSNTLGVYSSANNGLFQGAIISLSKIDITNYTKLKAVCTEISNGAIAICSARNINNYVKNTKFTTGITELDLTDYNGEYYIALYAINAVGWTRVSQLWLEV